jgi:hypothetical protein
VSEVLFDIGDSAVVSSDHGLSQKEDCGLRGSLVIIGIVNSVLQSVVAYLLCCYGTLCG